MAHANVTGSGVSRQAQFRRRFIFSLFTLIYISVMATAAAQDIVITEIMFNPDGDENAREFVEVMNRSDADVSLAGWLIGDGAAWDEIIPATGDNPILPAGAFALIFDPDYFTVDDPYPDIPSDTPLFTVADKALGSRGLSNTAAEPVSIITADGDTASVVHYDIGCPPGHSWERIIPGGGDGPDNFTPSIISGGSPGQANTVTDIGDVVPGSLLLSEVMAAPTDGAPEWVEIFNASGDPVDLFGWGIVDGSGGTSARIPAHNFIEPGRYGVLTASDGVSVPPGAANIAVSGFPTLNNDGDRLLLLTPSGAISDSMVYDDAPAGVSLERTVLRASAGIWNASAAHEGSTPGAANSILFDPDDRTGAILLTIAPNPFADRTTISYELPCPLARVTLAVYDRRGRRVALLRDGEESGSRWSGTWDGRSDGARVPSGPYIVHLEAVDRTGGGVLTAKEIAVAGARL
jgi:hypothetical protein